MSNELEELRKRANELINSVYNLSEDIKVELHKKKPKCRIGDFVRGWDEDSDNVIYGEVLAVAGKIDLKYYIGGHFWVENVEHATRPDAISFETAMNNPDEYEITFGSGTYWHPVEAKYVGLCIGDGRAKIRRKQDKQGDK